MISPDEVDEAIGRMQKAAIVYRMFFESNIEGREEFLGRYSRLTDACKRMGRSRSKASGLLRTEEISVDLIRLYECYLTHRQTAQMAELKRIIGERLTEARIKSLCVSPSEVAKVTSNKKGGPFDIALRVTGELWGVSEKTIRDKLKKQGYPHSAKDIQHIVKRASKTANNPKV